MLDSEMKQQQQKYNRFGKWWRGRQKKNGFKLEKKRVYK